MEYDATSASGDDRFGLHKQVIRKSCAVSWKWSAWWPALLKCNRADQP
jgi:hypothetical protein